jgi:hypothetical protein
LAILRPRSTWSSLTLPIFAINGCGPKVSAKHLPLFPSCQSSDEKSKGASYVNNTPQQLFFNSHICSHCMPIEALILHSQGTN